MKGKGGYSSRSFGFGRRNEVRANMKVNGESELGREKGIEKLDILYFCINHIQIVFNLKSGRLSSRPYE